MSSASATAPGIRRRKQLKPGERDALLASVAPIDRELLGALGTVPLRARYLVESLLSGRHRSPLKGTAPEFAEYRTYQIGDELKRIDWRLYARSDRLVVKQFEDESQLRTCLALDVSDSLRYRSRPDLMTKLDLARTVLAAIALLAKRQHDAVALALLGDLPGSADEGLIDFLPPSSSPAGHHALLARLESPPAAPQLDLGPALRRVSSLLPRGGLVVLASDFYCDLSALRSAIRLFRSQRLELVGLHVLDPMEIDFSSQERGRFVDLEDGTYLPLNAVAARSGYVRRFAAFRRELTELFRENEADFVTLRNDENPLPALAAYLARRLHAIR